MDDSGMMLRKWLLLLPLAPLALAACSKKSPNVPATETAAGSTASVGVAAPEPAEARLVRTRAFQCATGGRLELRDYEDGSTRVEIRKLTHVLSAVNVSSGALLQGDNISLRLFGDQATASENGIVLYAGCKAAS